MINKIKTIVEEINMGLLTAEEVTNLYLYGDKTKPANIEDTSIRPIDDKKLTNVDINEYMSGPGRFASPAFFDVIEQFFAPLDGTLLQLAFPASSNLAPEKACEAWGQKHG